MSDASSLKRSFSADKIKSDYAHVAWFYDAWGRLTEDKALQRLFELAKVEDGKQVLEIAVGTGRLFSRLVEHNAHGSNVGLDLSPAMLAHARKRLRSAPANAYRLEEGSAYALPYADSSFDYLFNTFMLDLLPETDYPKLLQEYRRVLRPGGTLGLAVFSFGTRPIHRFWYWLAKHFPSLLTDCRPVRLEPALRAAGFELVNHEEISQLTFPSAIYIARKGGHNE